MSENLLIEKKLRKDVLLNKIPLIKPLRFIIQKYENSCFYYLDDLCAYWSRYSQFGLSTKETCVMLKRALIWKFFREKYQNIKLSSVNEMYYKFLKEFNLDVPLNQEHLNPFAH
jgi:hypothetical protein